mmetsp:Transcript_52124/g.156447  ORF Transcript_52124/g.156447 Transcript_52124/m.156447 type:complete len:244 (+) Transcript_52124:410-1141(+)
MVTPSGPPVLPGSVPLGSESPVARHRHDLGTAPASESQPQEEEDGRRDLGAGPRPSRVRSERERQFRRGVHSRLHSVLLLCPAGGIRSGRERREYGEHPEGVERSAEDHEQARKGRRRRRFQGRCGGRLQLLSRRAVRVGSSLDHGIPYASHALPQGVRGHAHYGPHPEARHGGGDRPAGRPQDVQGGDRIRVGRRAGRRRAVLPALRVQCALRAEVYDRQENYGGGVAHAAKGNVRLEGRGG